MSFAINIVCNTNNNEWEYVVAAMIKLLGVKFRHLTDTNNENKNCN